LRDHVVLELVGIDRMYLNVYVPVWQAVEGVLKFFRIHGGHLVASTAMVEPITRRFVESIERYVRDNNIPMITFEKGRREDDIANHWRAGHELGELRPQQTGIGSREEQRNTKGRGSELVAVAARDARDNCMQSQPTQIIGHATGRVVGWSGTEYLRQ
jgi:hypothetical protein